MRTLKHFAQTFQYSLNSCVFESRVQLSLGRQDSQNWFLKDDSNLH